MSRTRPKGPAIGSLTLAAALVAGGGAPGQQSAVEGVDDGVDAFAQAALVVVLDIWNDEGVCDSRRLVRYRFEPGRVARAEVVLEREQRFFGHFGGHQLMENRFMVTKYGGVVDLASGDVIHDESLGDLLAVERGVVVDPVQNAYRESGVFAFDVASRRLRKLDPPGVWDLPGVHSPSGDLTAETTAAGELWLHSLAGEQRLLADGLGLTLSLLSSTGSVGPPVHWLDDKTLLTQVDNGQLVTVTLDGEVASLVDIEGLPAPVSPSRFELDGAGRLVYRCESSHLIDVAGRSAIASRWQAVGHGFEFETPRDPDHGHRVRYSGAEIGRAWCSPWQAATAPGWLAVPYAETGKNLSYPAGVLVWNARTKTWTEVEGAVNWIVGWTRGR